MSTAIISAISTLLLATASYWFTKQRERDVEWRKEKMIHYKALVNSMTGIIDGQATTEGNRDFSKACNDILMFAPQTVIEALMAFQNEIRISNTNRSIERHDDLLSKLFLEIRRDLDITPRDNKNTFRVRLWASGAKNNTA